MKFSDRPLVIVDVETGSLEPEDGEMIEIAWIVVDQVHLGEIIRGGDKLNVCYPLQVQPEAVKRNGYSEDAWRHGKHPVIVMRDFILDAKGGIFTSWNVTFDWGWVRRYLEESGLISSLDYHRLDIPSMAIQELKRIESLSLGSVCKTLGIEPEPFPHSAMNGAQKAWEVLRKLRRID